MMHFGVNVREIGRFARSGYMCGHSACAQCVCVCELNVVPLRVPDGFGPPGSGETGWTVILGGGNASLPAL